MKEEVSCSVGFPKDAKIDDTMIQQIVEDSIKNVFERVVFQHLARPEDHVYPSRIFFALESPA